MKKISFSLNSIEPLIQKISDLTRVQRIIISIVSFVVIIGLFGWFAFKPQLEEIKKLKAEISKQEDLLAKTKATAAQYAMYKKKMEEAQAKFNAVAKALPVTDEIPSLLTSISESGKDSGLTFLLFKPEAEKKQNFYAELPIRMQLDGTYHDLGEFFDQLAGMSRIVNIKDFDMKTKRGAALSISCMAETYKFIESAPESKPAKGKKKKRR